MHSPRLKQNQNRSEPHELLDNQSIKKTVKTTIFVCLSLT